MPINLNQNWLQILLLLSVMVLSACGGNSTPKLPPTLTSSSPTNGATEVAPDGSLSLTFSKAMDKASLKVSVNPAADLGSGVWDASGTKLSFDPPADLAPDTVYTLNLEGKDATGMALSGSKQLSFRTTPVGSPPNNPPGGDPPAPPPPTETPPPATPANFSAKPGDKAVALSWSANSEADLASYTLYWGTVADKLDNSSSVDKSKTSETVINLNNGTAYFFALSSKNSAGKESPRSETISATPLAPPLQGDTIPPAAPRDLAARSGDGEVTLVWSPNSETDLKGYNLFSGTSVDGLRFVGFVDKNITSRRVGGLSNGTMYYFALEAEDLSGNKSVRSAPLSVTPVDTTAPRLASSSPANNATNVNPTLSSISFTFNEPMQTGAVVLRCSYMIPTLPSAPCGKDGSGYFDTPVWSNSDRTLSFTRRGGALLPGMGPVYFLEVAGARDKGGNRMEPVTVRFETAVVEAPQLVSSFPTNEARNVPNQLEEVRFSFDRSIDTSTFRVRCAIDNATCHQDLATLLGSPTWSEQNRTVRFRPTRMLAQNSAYQWALEGRDSRGLTLNGGLLRFSTTDMPSLLATAPMDGTRGLPPAAYISLIFSKAMNVDSLIAAFQVYANAWDGSTSRRLAISRVEVFRPANGGYGYSFVPAEPYGEGMVVVWSLSRGARDTFGNPIPEIASGGFRTIQRVIVTLPANPALTGRVVRNCSINGCNNYPSNYLYVGYDSSKNNNVEHTIVERGIIGFSYNSSTFPQNAQFVRATLNLRQLRIIGTPFAADKLGSISLERVNLGPQLDGSDYNSAPLLCHNGQNCFARFNGPPDPIDGPVDVLSYLQADWAERNSRGYQTHIRLRFANNSPVSGGLIQVQEVQYRLDPTLTVEYLVP